MKKVVMYCIDIIIKGLGSQKELLAVMLIFILADYLTEIMVAVVKKKITRKIGFEGILKRGAIFIVVLLSGLLDIYVIRDGNTITVSIVHFYLFYEGSVIIRNLVKLGLPLPKVFMSILEKMKNNSM